MLDVALVVGLECLLELNLLGMTLGVEEFRFDTKGTLGDSGLAMDGTSFTLAPTRM